MEQTASNYKELPLHLIFPPLNMVRMSIDMDTVKELSEDIQKNGLLQPLVVKPSGDKYEIIAGHRRFLAMNRIGMLKCMCNIKDVPDLDVAIFRACENLSRVDMTPIEEAKAYSDLRKDFGLSYEEIGNRTGKNPGIVKRRVDLLKMPQEMIDALHKKLITVGVAEALSHIPDKTAQSYYISCAVDNGITVAVARQWVTDYEMAQVHKDNNIEVGDSIPSVFLDRKTFVACDTCGKPEDINNMKMIRVCPCCLKTIKGVMPQ